MILENFLIFESVFLSPCKNVRTRPILKKIRKRCPVFSKSSGQRKKNLRQIFSQHQKKKMNKNYILKNLKIKCLKKKKKKRVKKV